VKKPTTLGQQVKDAQRSLSSWSPEKKESARLEGLDIYLARSAVMLYTVSRCRKDDSLYGPVHGSMDGQKTACGQDIGDGWYIVTNGFDGEITCRKCLAILRRDPALLESIK